MDDIDLKKLYVFLSELIENRGKSFYDLLLEINYSVKNIEKNILLKKGSNSKEAEDMILTLMEERGVVYKDDIITKLDITSVPALDLMKRLESKYNYLAYSPGRGSKRSILTKIGDDLISQKAKLLLQKMDPRTSKRREMIIGLLELDDDTYLNDIVRKANSLFGHQFKWENGFLIRMKY